MFRQLSLPGFEPPQQPVNGLFFAVFPPTAFALRIRQIAEQQRAASHLRGNLLAPERLHISLLGFGRFSRLPRRLVDSAGEAAATVVAPPFDVSFDHILSFVGKPRPLVLCGEDGVAGLMTLRLHLSGAVEDARLARANAAYTPHITLLYDDDGVEEHTIDPVRWTVREFVLVHSLVGQSKYIPLGRWALR